MGAQKRFESLIDEVAAIAKPAALYQPCLVVGDFAYVSGHLPVLPDGSLVLGCLGLDLEIEAGKVAARRAGLASLVTLEQALGSLDAIKRVVKVFGMVAATGSFTQHPAVVNGCSELMQKSGAMRTGLEYEVLLVLHHYPLVLQLKLKQCSN